MIQDILALTTVFVAVVYAFWGIYKAVTPSKTGSSTQCYGCSSSGCSLHAINGSFNK